MISPSSNRFESSANRLIQLREILKTKEIDGFLLPVGDEYQNEYPPPSARRLAWLTGFTGSAGLVVVLQKTAAIFVDGRYTLQAKQQVDSSYYEQKDLMSGSPVEWISENLAAGAKIAYDPWLHTQAAIDNLTAKFTKTGIKLLAVKENPVDNLWKDRPLQPDAPVVIHDECFAGEPSVSKRSRLGKLLEKEQTDAAIIASPDSIAWLLNIRGSDTPHTPIALSFAILHKTGKVDWFIDLNKISDEIKIHLGNDISIHSISHMPQYLKELGKKGKKIRYDNKRSASWFYEILHACSATICKGDDPCLLPKALKNQTEIEGIRRAHHRDGVALTQLLVWIDKETRNRDVSEIEIEEKLEELRNRQERFKEPSFDTIAGSGEHGAIVHYRATLETNKILEKNTLFLLDSGGQYLDGTTDVTRTIVIGEPSAEQKRRFTQVLQGHIGIATAVFPAGTTGQQLDILARAPLWAEGKDYAHGTGHGVGAYLGVHEGPQGIHRRSTVPFEPGMIVSNEPGYYKTGEYGIRIENLILVIEKSIPDEEESQQKFYAFETLTLAPIDLRLIEPSLLTAKEMQWLNDYHRQVYEKLSPVLSSEEKFWLKNATQQLK